VHVSLVARLRSRSESHLNRHALPIALDLQGHLAARFGLCKRLGQSGEGIELGVVELGQQIACFQARLVRGAALLHLADLQAVSLERDAQISPLGSRSNGRIPARWSPADTSTAMAS